MSTERLAAGLLRFDIVAKVNVIAAGNTGNVIAVNRVIISANAIANAIGCRAANCAADNAADIIAGGIAGNLPRLLLKQLLA